MVIVARWAGLPFSETADLVGYLHMARFGTGTQKSISGHTTCQTLRRMGYGSRRSHQVSLPSVKSRKLWKTEAHQNQTIEDWKKKNAWSDESRILLDPSCLVTTVGTVVAV